MKDNSIFTAHNQTDQKLILKQSILCNRAAGSSIDIGTTGGTYIIPKGTYTIGALVDDLNRMIESNETNNQFSQSILIP